MRIESQVLSEDMELLPGANAIEVGTSNTAVADEAGRFTLQVASADAQIRISYVGFETRTFRAGTIDGTYVELPVSSEMLDEVTVTGGGGKKENDNTLWYVLGAVAATAIVAKIATGGKPRPRTVKA